MAGHGLILHAEVQARPDPLMSERMLEYWIRLHRLYGRPIQQVVHYLKRTRSLRARIDRLEIGATSHGYAVVRLWEQPAGPLLAAPELLPLTLRSSPSASQAFQVHPIPATDRKEKFHPLPCNVRVHIARFPNSDGSLPMEIPVDRLGQPPDRGQGRACLFRISPPSAGGRRCPASSPLAGGAAHWRCGD